MVVAMAVLVTVALVPVAAAYLQLGFGASAHTADRTAEAHAVTRALTQSVAEVEGTVAGEYAWSEREHAVSSVRTRLEPGIERIESAGDSGTVASRVTYNQTHADRFATTRCPGGDSGRRFGPCVADRGVVVQERAGETVVVGVALDVRVVAVDGRTTVFEVYQP